MQYPGAKGWGGWREERELHSGFLMSERKGIREGGRRAGSLGALRNAKRKSIRSNPAEREQSRVPTG